MSAGGLRFAPFEKGGYGGFAFVCARSKNKSPSVPLFQRGKGSAQLLSPQPSALSPQGGYTLIEVLVAFAVLALALTVLLGTLSGATRQVRWSADAGRAALHAQSLLAQVGVGEALQAGRRDGEFDDGRYRWTLDVAPYTDPLLPPPAGIDPFTPQLMQLRLAVEWGDGGRGQRMLLDSLRLVQPDATEGAGL
jgi:general secretion pathway protein I